MKVPSIFHAQPTKCFKIFRVFKMAPKKKGWQQRIDSARYGFDQQG